jgi:hypothetical protein
VKEEKQKEGGRKKGEGKERTRSLWRWASSLPQPVKASELRAGIFFLCM